jgi:hypothetical protein
MVGKWERICVLFNLYVIQKIAAPFDWYTCQVHIEDFVYVWQYCVIIQYRPMLYTKHLPDTRKIKAAYPSRYFSLNYSCVWHYFPAWEIGRMLHELKPPFVTFVMWYIFPCLHTLTEHPFYKINTLILSFRRVLHVIWFLLGVSPACDCW